MNEHPGIIGPHGGYRNLKSYQTAEIVHDATVKFCERFVDPRSRTTDQMVQAARSGKQNIAEGSQASGTSKKIELKLIGITTIFYVSGGYHSGVKNTPISGKSGSWLTRKIGPIRPIGPILKILLPRWLPTRLSA
jgi:hypothetical protein